MKSEQLFLAYEAVFARLSQAVVVDGDELAGLELHGRVSRWPSPFREAAQLALQDVSWRLPRRSRRHLAPELFERFACPERAARLLGSAARALPQRATA